jgi:hypothetical protein
MDHGSTNSLVLVWGGLETMHTKNLAQFAFDGKKAPHFLWELVSVLRGRASFLCAFRDVGYVTCTLAHMSSRPWRAHMVLHTSSQTHLHEPRYFLAVFRSHRALSSPSNDQACPMQGDKADNYPLNWFPTGSCYDLPLSPLCIHLNVDRFWQRSH